ncbi:uncharacterized protein DFL_004454 [Arthrobotrys flagrans]|uniref:Uncharacterized protein n=1 Tax=Arthrobotrys flagrans TaxID=97331 RepID=A0A437A4Q6_ARTFL|nr:hypothetical protein DFL_004454 [Arthrobotrys flagrans]
MLSMVLNVVRRPRCALFLFTAAFPLELPFHILPLPLAARKLSVVNSEGSAPVVSKFKSTTLTIGATPFILKSSKTSEKASIHEISSEKRSPIKAAPTTIIKRGGVDINASSA